MKSPREGKKIKCSCQQPPGLVTAIKDQRQKGVFPDIQSTSVQDHGGKLVRLRTSGSIRRDRMLAALPSVRSYLNQRARVKQLSQFRENHLLAYSTTFLYVVLVAVFFYNYNNICVDVINVFFIINQLSQLGVY